MTLSSSPPIAATAVPIASSQPMGVDTTTTSMTAHDPRAMTNRLVIKRQVGDPVPFDKLIVGGTLSLGFLLLIGGIVILAISLADQSTFKDATPNDFVSLGDNACQILNASSYRTVEEELNALTTRCIEEYRYTVQVVSETVSNGDEKKMFVSNVLTSVVCSSPCEFCLANKFRGPTYYAGVVVNEDGENISSSTLVECWVSRTDTLSDFYSCPNGDVPCYQLQDPSLPLKEATDSNHLGMIAAWVALVGSVVVIALGIWFAWRNRQALEQDAKLLAAAKDAENEESSEAMDGNDDALLTTPSNDDMA